MNGLWNLHDHKTEWRPIFRKRWKFLFSSDLNFIETDHSKAVLSTWFAGSLPYSIVFWWFTLLIILNFFLFCLSLSLSCLPICSMWMCLLWTVITLCSMFHKRNTHSFLRVNQTLAFYLLVWTWLSLNFQHVVIKTGAKLHSLHNAINRYMYAAACLTKYFLCLIISKENLPLSNRYTRFFENTKSKHKHSCYKCTCIYVKLFVVNRQSQNNCVWNGTLSLIVLYFFAKLNRTKSVNM